MVYIIYKKFPNDILYKTNQKDEIMKMNDKTLIINLFIMIYLNLKKEYQLNYASNKILYIKSIMGDVASSSLLSVLDDN